MHSENLLINNSGNGKAVETIGESFPQLNIVAALALIVETVDAVDGGTLVVTSQDEKVLRVLDFVGEQKADCLERLLASVYVVTQEEVIGLGRKTTVLKESEQVIILTMNIATNLPVSVSNGIGVQRPVPGNIP